MAIGPEHEILYLIKTAIKEHLHIKTQHKDNKVQIQLFWDDTCIDTDFIDYSEVVRVVERLNEGEYQ
jgi:hypothetical protein